MTFIDLFSGIGGFRLGMEAAGHECLGHVEIDKFANLSYDAIFKGEDLIGTDITKITDEQWLQYRGKVDCICGGFPCQSFSVAGHQRGFEDTRGTLFFEILRAARQIQPSYLFLENVKNLLSHDKGKTFEVMLSALDELGYDAEWCVLDSKNFGVPQHRERVFIIGHLRGRGTRKVFHFGRQSTAITRPESEQIVIPILTPERLNKRQNGRRYKENGDPSFTLTAQDRHGVIIQVGNIIKTDSFGGNPQRGRIYDLCGISPTLSTMQGGGQEPKIKLSLENGFRIRKLTPRECWRLQGFPDWCFDQVSQFNSDSQLYKQAGNSVTIPVVKWIAEKLEVDKCSQ